jgi:hypothetical protein
VVGDRRRAAEPDVVGKLPDRRALTAFLDTASEDGELRTTFEGPSSRDGSSPDELVPLLREVGFPLTSEGEHDENAPAVDGKAAVLALAERLTGIRVTESLLQDATYELGPRPRTAR